MARRRRPQAACAAIHEPGTSGSDLGNPRLGVATRWERSLLPEQHYEPAGRALTGAGGASDPRAWLDGALKTGLSWVALSTREHPSVRHQTGAPFLARPVKRYDTIGVAFPGPMAHRHPRWPFVDSIGCRRYLPGLGLRRTRVRRAIARSVRLPGLPLAMSLVRPITPRSLERRKNQPDDSGSGIGHSPRWA